MQNIKELRLNCACSSLAGNTVANCSTAMAQFVRGIGWWSSRFAEHSNVTGTCTREASCLHFPGTQTGRGEWRTRAFQADSTTTQGPTLGAFFATGVGSPTAGITGTMRQEKRGVEIEIGMDRAEKGACHYAIS